MSSVAGIGRSDLGSITAKIKKSEGVKEVKSSLRKEPSKKFDYVPFAR